VFGERSFKTSPIQSGWRFSLLFSWLGEFFSRASLVLPSLKILAFLLAGFSSYHNSIYESIPDTISFYRIKAWEQQYEGDLSEKHT
jgi:hypothetical protein